MKRLLSFLLVLILLGSLTACGGSGKDTQAEDLDEYTGRYYLVSRDKAPGSMDQYLRLDEEKEARLVLDGKTRDGRWKLKKDTLTLTMDDDEEYEGTLDAEEGTIEIEIDGAGCLFLKGKKAAEKYLAEHGGTEQETEAQQTEELPTEAPETTDTEAPEPVTETETPEPATETQTEPPATETEPPATEPTETEGPTAPDTGSFAGTYLATGIFYDGEEEFSDEAMRAYKQYLYIDLREDGTGKLIVGAVEGVPMLQEDEITWDESGLTYQGYTMPLTRENGNLHLNDYGSEYIVLEPFSGTPLTEDQYYWNGTWYGMLYFDATCTGTAEPVASTGYLIYVTICLDETGNGSLELYEPTGKFGEEKLASVSCSVNENGDLLLDGSMEIRINDEGIFIGIQPRTWTFEKQDEDGIFRIHNSYKVSADGGTVSFGIVIAPWGADTNWDPEEEDLDIAFNEDDFAFIDSFYDVICPPYMLADWK